MNLKNNWVEDEVNALKQEISNVKANKKNKVSKWTVFFILLVLIFVFAYTQLHN
jgi:t-SNARE complex subunit (syntaxin)